MRKPVRTSIINAFMISTVLVTACSESSGGPPVGPVPAVDSIHVTGAPDDYLIAGQLIDLAVVPRATDGSTVVGAPIDWSSSDTGVVVVTGAGEIQARATGFALVTAASGRATTTVELEVREEFTVGPDGGTWVLASGRVELKLGTAAVAEEMPLQLREVRDQTGPPNTIPGTHFELSPPISVSEAWRLSLTVRYRDELIPGGMLEQSALLHFLRDSVWHMGSSLRDTVENRVVNSLSHISRFAVAGAPVDSVVVQSPVLDEAVYTGGSAAFAASVWTYSSHSFRDIELVGHPVTWSSSEPSVGAVDAMGLFHARSPGETTLTASAAGASTSTRIRVLPAPNVRVSGLTDWVTLGGNARHDGYVPAVIEPSRYLLTWTSAPLGSLRGMATGGGKVFAGHSNGFRAFAALDGTLLWNTVASSSAPAYAQEKVYLLEDGRLVARNAATGDTAFTTSGSSVFNFQSPVIDEGVVYVNADVAKAVDASSGTVIWRQPRSAEWNTTAALSQDYLFFRGDVLGSGRAGDVVVLQPGTGTRAREPLRDGGRSTPVVGDMWILTSDRGSITAFDVARPTVPVWSKQAAYFRLPVAANGVVYAVNYRPTNSVDAIRAVEAIREADGTPLWSWTPRQFDYPVGPMLVTDNLLFVGVGYNGSPRRTVAIDLLSGKAVWGYPAGGVIAMDAAGRLFIANEYTGEVLSFTLN